MTDDLQVGLTALLNECFAAAGESMVTKYVVIVETLDSEGDRSTWAVCEPSMRRWETLGMVEYAKTIDIATMTANEVHDA